MYGAIFAGGLVVVAVFVFVCKVEAKKRRFLKEAERRRKENLAKAKKPGRVFFDNCHAILWGSLGFSYCYAFVHGG